jgi:hypothetical protein
MVGRRPFLLVILRALVIQVQESPTDMQRFVLAMVDDGRPKKRRFPAQTLMLTLC